MVVTKQTGIQALRDDLATFRWFGTEYMVDRGYAPRRKLLDELEAAAEPSAPDAIVWDDVSLDFHVRTCRLRLVRSRIPRRDARLQAQVEGRGRVAVDKALLRALMADGTLPQGSGPSEALQWLVENRPGSILQLPEQFRFVGPMFQHRYETGVEPVPTAKAASVAVVLSYHDHANVTIKCLEHLAHQALTADLEVVVVDNRSSPAERDRVDAALARLFPRRDGPGPKVVATHLAYDAPFNLSDQNNVAAASTSAEVLVLLNNDCFVLDPDCIQTMADWAMTPGIGSVAPRMLGLGGRLMTAGVNAGIDPGMGIARVWECEFPVFSRLVRCTAANSTACAAINRAAWDDVGGMDADAFPSQYDDADLCLRMAARGWRHLYVGKVSVFHEPGTTEERKKPEIARLMEQLLERHDVSAASHVTPDFEVLKKGPKLANDDARAWRDFVGSFQQVVNWKKDVEDGAPVAGGEPVVEAWRELERMAEAHQGIPAGSREGDDWYRDEQCRLMRQCVRICRAFGEYRGEHGYDEILSIVDEQLRLAQAGASRETGPSQ